MPGHDEVRADKAWATLVKRTGEAVVALNQRAEEYDMSGYTLREVRLQGPAVVGTGFRAVVKVQDEAGQVYVGFRAAETMEDVLRQVNSGLADNTLKLKVEEPYKPPQGR